jgi:hybrid cluster-associated redox disulfide protein
MGGPLATKEITKDMLIGDVIERFPETIGVFKKYFGQGCFTCPGAKNEDISFGSTIHNVDCEMVLRELNKTIKGR